MGQPVRRQFCRLGKLALGALGAFGVRKVTGECERERVSSGERVHGSWLSLFLYRPLLRTQLALTLANRPSSLDRGHGQCRRHGCVAEIQT